MHARWRARARALGVVLAGAAALFAGLLLAARVVPLPDEFFSEPSTVVEFADGSPAHVFLSPDEKWRIRVRLDEVDRAYLDALIRLEDKRFYEHPGVDPFAVVRAAVSNLLRGRVVSGGSTLTMQLVRVREPRPRSFVSKVVEAFRALQVEVRLSKDEILAAYLQYVPFGKNVEGVEAAALSYFGHRATSLAPAEIATLLAVPQMPTKRFPSPKHARVLRGARDQIAERLLRWESLTLGRSERLASPEAVLAEVVATPVPDELQPFPRLAPHAAVWIREQHPGETRIRSTLDRGAQLLAERTMAGARDELGRRGIHNGALVVVDHQTSEVRALVGSFDFWDEAHGGQIVGFDNPRSPGSALKPFLYAMGLDRGLLLPDFLVLDTPRVYGTYAPKNYDGTYAGLVRFEDALSRSLNVPFVNLVRRVGVERFVGQLRMMGAESLAKEPGFYGLSSAIGGLELTPLELAGFYATLAEGGKYRPLRWIEHDDAHAALHHLSARELAARAARDQDEVERHADEGEAAEQGGESETAGDPRLEGPASGLLAGKVVDPAKAPEGAKASGQADTVRPGSGRKSSGGPGRLRASKGRRHFTPWTPPPRDPSGLAVFSPGATHLTRKALSLRDRPDFPARRRFTGLPAHLHWKTGTSFGHRDAWAAGSGPRYTAVVWLGNFDNTPSASLVGADSAGPILFDVLEALASKADPGGEVPPSDLASVEVCAYSGRLPGPACTERRRVPALAKSVPTERCPYHVALDVDVKTGLALTPACRGSAQYPSYRTESFLVWPSSLRRWLDDEHRRVPEPPSFAPGCEQAESPRAPQIVSPPANHVALLIPGLAPDKQEIPLAAEAGVGAGQLSWFVDGEFLGTVRVEERLWWRPVPGEHEIVVTDETGRSAKRKLDVRTRL